MANRTLFPDTSAEARDTHERSGTAMSKRRAVLNLVVDHPGLTACELCQTAESIRLGRTRHEISAETADGCRLGLSRHEISRRLPELRKAGLVVNGPARTCAVAGSRQMTWNAATQ